MVPSFNHPPTAALLNILGPPAQGMTMHVKIAIHARTALHVKTELHGDIVQHVNFATHVSHVVHGANVYKANYKSLPQAEWLGI